MRIGNPGALLLLIAIPLALAFLAAAVGRRRKLIAEFGEPRLLARIALAVDPVRRRTKAILWVAAIALAAVALLRPQFGAKEVLVKRRGIDVVFAIDTSLSMLARDLPPTRFQRAKQEVQRILDQLGGDRVALIAFAGGAYVQCPFTLDYGAVRLFLENLAVGSAPKAGTNVEVAIRRADELLASQEKKYKAIVIFTDGEQLAGDAIAAAREAADHGVRIFTVGVGTPAGEVIPIQDDAGRSMGVKRDETGEVVVSRLDEATLAEIARVTGGRSVLLGASGDPGAELVEQLESFEKREVSSRTAVQFEERHVWFSIAAVLLLALDLALPESRRRAARAARRAA